MFLIRSNRIRFGFDSDSIRIRDLRIEPESNSTESFHEKSWKETETVRFGRIARIFTWKRGRNRSFRPFRTIFSRIRIESNRIEFRIELNRITNRIQMILFESESNLNDSRFDRIEFEFDSIRFDSFGTLMIIFSKCEK